MRNPLDFRDHSRGASRLSSVLPGFLVVAGIWYESVFFFFFISLEDSIVFGKRSDWPAARTPGPPVAGDIVAPV